MPLTNDESFRSRFNIRDEDTPTDSYVATASAVIEEWVGDEAYADAEGDSPDDFARALKLTEAENYLAMHYAFPVLSLQIESGVIVLADRSEGETVRQFNRPKEIKEGAQYFLDLAQELAAPYRQSLQGEASTGSMRPTLFGAAKALRRTLVC